MEPPAPTMEMACNASAWEYPQRARNHAYSPVSSISIDSGGTTRRNDLVGFVDSLRESVFVALHCVSPIPFSTSFISIRFAAGLAPEAGASTVVHKSCWGKFHQIGKRETP